MSVSSISGRLGYILGMTTITDPSAGAQTPRVAGEKETILALLAFQRDTLRLKCSGLTDVKLAYQHEPSTLTLGGLLKHVAVSSRSTADILDTPT